MGGRLPSPPLENQKSHSSRKASSSNSANAIKPHHKTSKRARPHSATAHHEHVAHGISDGRHKRAWKACERCKMKKAKCDGEFPCQRCNDDGLVCTAGVRKTIEYKQLPRGYTAVLEHNQFALAATVHKLYAMARDQQRWDLGEPELNDRGQPVIHNIASKLGCIRPKSDIDLPIHSVFPKDEVGIVELERQLGEQQKERESVERTTTTEMEPQSSRNLSDQSSPSEQDHSDFEFDCRKQVYGGGNVMAMSSQSFGGYDGFDMDLAPSAVNATVMFPSQILAMPGYPPQWARAPRSEFGTIRPHMLSCPNPEVMIVMDDSMMFLGYRYDTESTRL
ncbi:hypothetical protein BGZ61DRAFT_500788 [Ilyonectria robusta]|uniref:uncharacterized protein n=1 Tax=Ilyonectria robusta TaxID=1079257 RepID=UPI001E8D985A|nr:uncharacterized protein BGZ61DRAFT_500788 [Ilyonectria robusta]KAH8652878.1 hypothetical protein BGZ61DRAFT_500788 [Ilyonectria robusta]